MNKIINRACFSDEAAYLGWKAENCEKCKKCVHFNEQLHRMPAFKCAIQRDIEMQHNGCRGVTVRTMDMVSHSVCPMLRPKVVVSKMEIAETPKAEAAPLIAAQGPTPFQKLAMDRHIRDYIADAYEEILVHWSSNYGNHKDPEGFRKAIQGRFIHLLRIPILTEDDKGAHAYIEQIVNAKSAKEMMAIIKKDAYGMYLKGREKFEKRKENLVNQTESQFKDSLTAEERKRYFFIPQITLDVVTLYAAKAQKLAAERKISELRKLSRELKNSLQWHQDNKRKRLDDKLMLLGRRALADLLADGQRDLQILYITVNQECLRSNPNYPHQDIRCNAVVAKLLLDFLFDFGNSLCKVIAQRIGTTVSPYVHAPQVQFLDAAMIAYAGKEDFDYQNPQVQLALKIFTNRILRIDFSKFYIPE